MKQFKITFVLTMLLSMVGLQAYADWDTSFKVNIGTLYYYLDLSNNKAEVTSMPSGNYTGDVEIPSSIMYNSTNYDVTRIDNNAFEGCSGLTSITIPNSVTSIGQDAFSGCSGMTSIDIPNSVTSIGGGAFNYCTGLTSFRFPNQLRTIGANVLANCQVTSIIIPGSVRTIEQGAFVSCQNLQDVYCFAPEVPTAHSLTFYNLNTNNVTLHVQSELIDDYSSAAVWKTLKQVVALTSDEMDAIAEAYDPNAIKVGDLYYHIDVNNNIATVTSFWYAGNIVIPTKISWENSDFDVTCIEEYAFEGCTGLTSVIIPNSVTSIGNQAFYKCSGLTSVTIPNSVTSIGNQAFYNCSNLTSVTLNSNFSVGLEKKTNFGTQVTEYIIGDDVTSIGYQAFYNCSGLTSVTIGNSVTSIGNQAFYKCSGLTSVTIPNSVTSIGNQAFYNCSGLTSITIPNSVTSIGNSAFYGCPDLTFVTIPSSVTSIGDDAFGYCLSLTKVIVSNIAAWCGIYFVGGGNANPLSSAHHLYSDENTEITDLVIPDGVTSISPCSFWSCTGLESVTIPNSVTSIGGNAFTYCSNLTSLTLNSNAIASQAAAIGNIFGGAPITELIIGEDVTNIGNNAFSGYSGLTSVTIGSGVTSIGDYAFNGCTGLTSVEIPNSVTSIGGGAFHGCSGLTSVTIPNSVTSIDSWAFYDCSSLTSVTVDINTPLVISWNTFYNCANATLYVPAGCKAAYEAADYWKDFNEIIEMAAPTNIVFADENVKAVCVAHWDTNGDGELSTDEAAAVTTISDYFKVNSSITSFNEFAYFTGVTSIDMSAFNSCTNLASITIPNSVTSIGMNAFTSCTSLTSVTIPNSVTSIGVQAFYNCSSLTSVTIGGGSIGNGAFDSCTNLASVIIGSGVTSIGGYAFRLCNLSSITVDGENPTLDSRDNCKAVINSSTNELVLGCKNTIIPNTVTSIYGGAFAGCTGLTSITIPSSVTSIGNVAFEGCTSLTTITIPSSVTTIGTGVFDGCSSMTSIKVMHDTPISINNMTLNYLYSRATLYVPAGSKAAYEAANNWKEFGTIEEMDIESVTIAMKTGGGAARSMIAYSSKYGLDFTDRPELKAYIACGYNSKKEVMLVHVNVVPPYTGMVIKTTNGIYDGGEYDVPTTTEDYYYANLLVPVVETGTVTPTETIDDVEYTNFTIGTLVGGGIGFVKLTTNWTTHNKSYLRVPTSLYENTSYARAIRGFGVEFVEGEKATAILNAKRNTPENNGDYYDLQGRKVKPNRQGLYIHKGKKVFIK